MTIDSAHRVQSLYVPVSDGVRLAIDIWLPVERIARGELVDRLGVGVDPGAHLDAPSSLSGRPAHGE
jgi:hypothetical protein